MSNRIVLDDKFYIEEDTQSWNLIEKTSPAKLKDGTHKFEENGERAFNTEISYHPTIGVALSTYLNRSLKGSTGIADVLAKLSAAEERVEKITFGG